MVDQDRPEGLPGGAELAFKQGQLASGGGYGLQSLMVVSALKGLALCQAQWNVHLI